MKRLFWILVMMFGFFATTMQEMSKAMRDMSGQMNDMAEQMNKGTMDPATTAKMHERMNAMNNTMESMKKGDQ